MDIPILIKVIPSRRRTSCLSHDDDGSKEGKESLLISLRQQIKSKDELVLKDEQVARLEATIVSLEEKLINMSLDLASSKATEDVLSLILSKSIQQKQHGNDTLHKDNNKKKYRRGSNLLMSSLPNLGSFIDSLRRQSDTPLEAKGEDTTSEDTTLLEDGSSLVSQNQITTSNTVAERRASLFSTLQWPED